jgi:hypothetical protein
MTNGLSLSYAKEYYEMISGLWQVERISTIEDGMRERIRDVEDGKWKINDLFSEDAPLPKRTTHRVTICNLLN